MVDKGLDAVEDVSLTLASVPVTISVSNELSISVWEVRISDEMGGLAVLVVKTSVSLTDAVSAKQE